MGLSPGRGPFRPESARFFRALESHRTPAASRRGVGAPVIALLLVGLQQTETDPKRESSTCAAGQRSNDWKEKTAGPAENRSDFLRLFGSFIIRGMTEFP